MFDVPHENISLILDHTLFAAGTINEAVMLAEVMIHH